VWGSGLGPTLHSQPHPYGNCAGSGRAIISSLLAITHHIIIIAIGHVALAIASAIVLIYAQYDHGCHLATQFCLEPNDYEKLLILAGLALYTRLQEGRDERRQYTERQRRWLTGGGGVTRGNATTSQTRGAKGAR
jgi:hypothetical protein